ncbi:hypothetical protein K431DRAFT_11443 [Polychaeton citri CBS 116435]|uniref:Uncharacterized protein n=1 Tax=Polychaeton citri CBS 116435 TaxID=1314669 RepID=A0A9P4PZG4_9PEZI|nr:hypothetical protein K431DRAFT_11443 [Polychaeton citri CBS 116435]
MSLSHRRDRSEGTMQSTCLPLGTLLWGAGRRRSAVQCSRTHPITCRIGHSPSEWQPACMNSTLRTGVLCKPAPRAVPPNPARLLSLRCLYDLRCNTPLVTMLPLHLLGWHASCPTPWHPLDWAQLDSPPCLNDGGLLTLRQRDRWMQLMLDPCASS